MWISRAITIVFSKIICYLIFITFDPDFKKNQQNYSTANINRKVSWYCKGMVKMTTIRLSTDSHKLHHNDLKISILVGPMLACTAKFVSYPSHFSCLKPFSHLRYVQTKRCFSVIYFPIYVKLFIFFTSNSAEMWTLWKANSL